MDSQKTGTAGAEGVDYQLNLILLCVLRAIEEYGDKFKVTTELKSLGKFDDLILYYTSNVDNTEFRRCLQAKHKTNENMNIALNDLLIDSKKKFNLYEYFKSYRELLLLPSETEVLKDIIIFTNLKFNKNVEPYIEPIKSSEDIFHFGNEKTDGTLPAFYKFNSKFREIFKYYPLIKLAQQLLVYSYSKKIEMKHNNNNFKDYHNVLAKYVIDVKNKCFHPSFSNGDQITDPTTKVFREILLEELRLNKSYVDSNNALNTDNFKMILSANFGANPSSDWPKEATLLDEELKEVDGFFNHLIFGVNQPNEQELKSYIQNEIITVYKTSEAVTALLVPSLLDKVRDWFKETEVSFLAKAKMDQLREYVNSQIVILSLSDAFCGELKAEQINFQTINLQERLDSFYGDRKNSILYVQALKKNMRLSSIKILHSLQNSKSDTKFLFVNLKKGVMKKIMKLISLFAESQEYTIFAIEAVDVQLLDTIYFQLDKVIEDHTHKKFIIISEELNIPDDYLENCVNVLDETAFDHLSEETKAKLLNKEVEFQGDEVVMKVLLRECDVSRFEPINWWLPLMFNEKTIIGPAMEISNGYNIKYFVTRSFYQMSIILDEEITKMDIVVTTLEDFKIQRDVNSGRNIHYLRKNPEDNRWCWRKTWGQISNLLKHKTNRHPLETGLDFRLQIISDNAGMGKSTIISHIAHELKRDDPSLWVIRFNLIAFSSELSKLHGTMMPNTNYDEFISRELLKFTPHSLEENLFKLQMTREDDPKMIFIFDGFDEVNGICQERTTEIIKNLLNRSSVERIIISTRPHLQEILEDEFSVLAINLHPFSNEDRIQFLIKYWSESASLQKYEIIKGKIEVFAKQVLRSFSDTIAKFTGVPLQMRMIAEILENDAMKYLIGELTTVREWIPISIGCMYDHFVDKKVEIYKKEKAQCTTSNQVMESALNVMEAKIHNMHAALAMNSIFKGEARLEASDEDMLSMLKFGLVYQRNGKYYFIHQTFAEYYVAICLTGRRIQLEIEMFVPVINISNTHNIQVFLNDLITEDETAYEKLKLMFKSVIKGNTKTLHAAERLLNADDWNDENSKFLKVYFDSIADIDTERVSSDIIISLLKMAESINNNSITIKKVIDNVKIRFQGRSEVYKPLVSFVIENINEIDAITGEKEKYLEVVKYLVDFLIFVEEKKYVESNFIDEQLECFEFCLTNGCIFTFFDYIYDRRVHVLDELLKLNSDRIDSDNIEPYFTWFETKMKISSASLLYLISFNVIESIFSNNFSHNSLQPENSSLLQCYLTRFLNHAKKKYDVDHIDSITDPRFTISFVESFKRLFRISPSNTIDKILCSFLVNDCRIIVLTDFVEFPDDELTQIEYCCLWSKFEILKYLLDLVDTNEESIQEKCADILKSLKDRLPIETFRKVICKRSDYTLETILQRACEGNDASQMRIISSWIDSDEVFKSLTSIESQSAFFSCVALLELIEVEFSNRIENFLINNSHVYFEGDYFQFEDKTYYQLDNYRDYCRKLLSSLLNALETRVNWKNLFLLLCQNDSAFVDLYYKMTINNFYCEGVERLLKLAEKNHFLDSFKFQQNTFGSNEGATMYSIKSPPSNLIENYVCKKNVNPNVGGVEYKWSFIILCLLRATKVYDNRFKLYKDMKDTTSLRNIILKYSIYDTVFKRYLHVIHVTVEKKNIALDDLLIDTKKDCNLYRYLESYIEKLIPSYKDATVLRDMIIFTNLKFNKNVEPYIEPIKSSEDIFHFGNEKTDGTLPAFYKFNSKFREIFKYYPLIKLAQQLLVYSYSKKIEMKHNNNNFKDYHNVLAKYVIDVDNKCFHSSFSEGYRITDPTTRVFREILLEELELISNRWNEESYVDWDTALNAKNFRFILSSDFGRTNSSSDWPKKAMLSNKEYKEVDGFFNHLIFGVNQPNVQELKSYIQNEIISVYKTSEAETALLVPSLLDKVHDWFKETEVSFLAKVKMDQLREYVNSQIVILSLSDAFCGELKAEQINFQTINLQERLDSFYGDKKKSILYVQTIKKYTRLSSIKILHSLQNSKSDTKFLFVNLKKGEMKKIMKLISLFEETQEYTVFAIEAVDVQLLETVYIQLDKVIEEQKHKKIIIISEKCDISDEYRDICDRISDETAFDHLSQETKANLLDKKVESQSHSIAIKELIREGDIGRFESANWWLPLMSKERIIIGPEMLTTNGYNIKYYIPRSFYQLSIILDEEIANIKKIDIVVTTLEDFKKQTKVNSKENIHYLEKDSDGNRWCWKKTWGQISNLLKHKTNRHPLETGLDFRLQIIADNAGMGKSTIISHIAHELKRDDPSLWVIRFNLIAFSSELSKFHGTMMPNTNYDEFISRELLKFTSHSLEENLFKLQMTREDDPKMIFIFDGFDEVNGICQERTTEIIKNLLNRSSVERIIISTRPHLQEILENEFSVLAINLQPFSNEDKIQFLVKYWSESASLQKYEIIKGKIEVFAKQVLRSFSDTIAEFTGIPLQMRMIAEILENDAMKYLIGELTTVREWIPVSIGCMYDHFVDKKVEIYKKEKAQCTTSNQVMESALNVMETKLHNMHAALAMNSIFKGEARLEASDENMLSMLKFGLVYQRNGKYYFIHQTFAEYYVAICLTGRRIQLEIEMFVPVINISNTHNIRVFLNDLITEDETAYEKLKLMFKSVIKGNTKTLHAAERLLNATDWHDENSKFLKVYFDSIADIDTERVSSDIIISLLKMAESINNNSITIKKVIDNIKIRFESRSGVYKPLVSFIFEHMSKICSISGEKEKYIEVVNYWVDFLIFVEEKKYVESNFIDEQFKCFEFCLTNGCISTFFDYIYDRRVHVLVELLKLNKKEKAHKEKKKCLIQ